MLKQVQKIFPGENWLGGGGLSLLPFFRVGISTMVKSQSFFRGGGGETTRGGETAL